MPRLFWLCLLLLAGPLAADPISDAGKSFQFSAPAGWVAGLGPEGSIHLAPRQGDTTAGIDLMFRPDSLLPTPITPQALGILADAYTQQGHQVLSKKLVDVQERQSVRIDYQLVTKNGASRGFSLFIPGLTSGVYLVSAFCDDARFKQLEQLVATALQTTRFLH